LIMTSSFTFPSLVGDILYVVLFSEYKKNVKNKLSAVNSL